MKDIIRISHKWYDGDKLIYRERRIIIKGNKKK